MAKDPNMPLIDVTTDDPSNSITPSSATNAKMLASMRKVNVPEAVKTLLGRSGKTVKTWGEFNRLMQSQIRHSKHGRRFRTSQRVVLLILAKLREAYFSKEAKKEHKKSTKAGSPGPSTKKVRIQVPEGHIVTDNTGGWSSASRTNRGRGQKWW